MEITKIAEDRNICNIEAKYANPENLNYYLIKGSNSDLNVQIIKQKSFLSEFGNIELAIIGSSHYIKIKNVFTELLTCTDEQISNQDLITKKKGSKIQIEYNFNIFTYKTIAKNIIIKSETEFFKEEQQLYHQENTLKHFFGKNTALTALKLRILQKNKCVIDTWHTYPEYSSIIYSTSLISNC